MVGAMCTEKLLRRWDMMIFTGNPLSKWKYEFPDRYNLRNYLVDSLLWIVSKKSLYINRRRWSPRDSGSCRCLASPELFVVSALARVSRDSQIWRELLSTRKLAKLFGERELGREGVSCPESVICVSMISVASVDQIANLSIYIDFDHVHVIHSQHLAYFLSRERTLPCRKTLTVHRTLFSPIVGGRRLNLEQGRRRRRRPPCVAAAARRRRKFVSGQFDEENPFVQNLSVLLVHADKGVSVLVVDRIGDIYRSLPRRADVIVTTVGARHKCQQGSGFEPPMYVDNCY
ncbi:hypothetical protein F511_36034 [Dorcoceras hygrometricum]|uniref:Uncharacterized protein n=1 Tax=Dorcoceras hygrometricum TaxID=472368 RepID=A0A2Z7CQ24_9LAMI|nr:hypothetical protein F511_36034 [Dorcoceras hygrometricum]